MEELLKMTSLFGSSSDDYGHCCPPVFDPYTLVALLGGIALATYFLRIVIITDPDLPPRRRRSIEYFGKFLSTLNLYLDSLVLNATPLTRHTLEKNAAKPINV